MLDESKSATLAEMNQAKVEDLDFPGLKAAGRSAEEQAASILEAMTFEEKAGFISGYKSLGIRALPRLGLPSVWMSDATSGVRSYGPAAAFPSGVAMAASWDRQLIARAAGSIAETARAKGISILLGPGVNIARIPTCGRNFEYFGEDPFLAGEMAAAYISACSKKGVICTVKHLAANNSEYDRHKISSDMDERTLRELYLPAFETAVKKGGATALMTAYNPINGVWASENRRLITDILRGEWGFEGMVISDWNSLYSTSGPMNAGMDLEMPQARWLSRERIQKAVESGEVPQQKLDDMCGRILRTLFTAGVYSRPVKDTDSREFHEEHNKRALQTAEAGIVLLKNNNKALP
ncbi:MAG: beta-glucosidase, partial [Spirochaetales bacterium]